jgi:hypothetical protein
MTEDTMVGEDGSVTIESAAELLNVEVRNDPPVVGDRVAPDRAPG